MELTEVVLVSDVELLSVTELVCEEVDDVIVLAVIVSVTVVMLVWLVLCTVVELVSVEVLVETTVLDVAVDVAEVVIGVAELRVVVVLSGAAPMEGVDMLMRLML
jgi:hypothetical protein